MAKKKVELADFCKECQRRHIENKGYKTDKDGKEIIKWPIKCIGIQKNHFESCRYNEDTGEVETGLVDLEGIVDSEIFNKLTPIEKTRLQYFYNPLLWAKDMLGWTPYNPNRRWYQEYQKEYLLCTAEKKVGRFSRRLGKTEVICVRAPQFCDTFPRPRPIYVIVVPFQNLATEIFGRLKSMLESDTSVFRGKVRTKQKPFQEVAIQRTGKFNDTAYIRGFTTGASSGKGATSLRGQKADEVALDEGAYLHPSDYNAILPLLEERKGVKIQSFSTPSAIENNFKNWCLKDPAYKDFHYPYSVLLNTVYTQEEYDEKVADYKRTLGYVGFMLEFQADFYEDNNKVFPETWIKKCGKFYSYAERKSEVEDHQFKKFYLGVDWNAWKNGVNIAVHSYDIRTGATKIEAKRIISDANKDKMVFNQIQTEGVYRVLEMFDNFECDGLYADAGYGSLHAEVLTQALEDRKMVHKLRIVDFQGITESIHPLTEEKIRQRNKPLMVNILRSRMEDGKFEYSTKEEGFLKDADENKDCFPYQADRYIIEKFDSKGMPIFKGPVDHYLDANFLASLAIAEKAENLFEVSVEFGLPDINNQAKTSIDAILNRKLKTVASDLRNSVAKSYKGYDDGTHFDEEQEGYGNSTLVIPDRGDRLANSTLFATMKTTRSTGRKRGHFGNGYF